jgi:CheY-like chemotaxis protein
MKKILIVEDNNDFREILHRFITKLGYHTIKARNSKEAIECAEAEQPDLIFMDLDLPDADGIKTTAILRQNPKTSHISVVAISRSAKRYPVSIILRSAIGLALTT